MAENDTEAPPIPQYPTGLKARGKRLRRELHTSADFSGCPETRIVVEEACYLTDEIDRLRRIVRSASANTRIAGYNGQLVSMPEPDDLRKNQTILLSMLKALRLPEEGGGDRKLTRSQAGNVAAAARWNA